MEIETHHNINKKYKNVVELAWWQRLLQKSNSLEKDRQIRSFKPDLDLPTNQIHTSKYNFLTFVPKNLMEQFSKPPNLYFLIIGIFQTFPNISSTGGIPTMYIPLSIIIVITAIKDLYEDYRRSISDQLQNEQKVIKILENGQQEQIASKKILVGQILKIKKNQQIPCDGLLIYCPQVFAYVETKNLDGQTNIKRKAFLKELQEAVTIDNQLHIKLPVIQVKYEKPNTNMNSFKGYININNENIAINQNHIFLRGSKLKNIDYIYLLSLYTGHDSKILLSMNIPTAKKSTLEIKLSKLIVLIFLSVLFISIILAILKQKNKKTVSNIQNFSKATRFFINFMSWVLNLTNLVPISLIVTIQAVRLLQSKLLSYDKNMGTKQFPAMVNCSNIIEDLGVIQLIASDKTGTLTKNQLTLRLISDGENIYNQQSIMIPPFILKMMAICHQAYVHQGEFQSISQDQVCILKFCKSNNCMLIDRSDYQLILQLIGIPQSIKILHVIEFTSQRRRQSVIFKDQKDLFFIVTKGADQQMDKITRNTPLKEKVFRDVNKFAHAGFRTLIYASQELDQMYVTNWLKKYKIAHQQSNQGTMKKLQIQIQSNLDILCTTGIEDQLQDGVIDTIKTILDAQIKFIIISGDKPETVFAIAKNLKIGDPYLAPTNQYKSEYLMRDLVVFARCTPREKEQIVSQIPLKTLAIGDGANDVSMITKAAIGVGISGKQGRAAVQAADFGIPEFKYLKKLLFYYGRQCYRKNAEMVKYNFYKNFLYTFPQITFGFISSFSGVYIYETYLSQLFNLLFCALPIIIYSLFDQVQEQQVLINNSKNSYMHSKKRVFFNDTTIILCLLQSIIIGLGVSYIAFFLGISLNRSPSDFTIIDNSTLLMLYVVVYVNVKVIIMSKRITIGMIFLCIMGVSLYFASYRLIFKFATDINLQDNNLFIGKSGLIILSCILCSLIVTTIIEYFNKETYKINKNQFNSFNQFS